MLTRGTSVALWLIAQLGCSSAVPPETAEPESVSPEVSAVPAALDVVAAPTGLVSVGRIRSVDDFLKSAFQWVGAPVSYDELLGGELPEIAALLTPTAPLDLAVMLDPGAISAPRFFSAVSIGLTSGDGATEYFRKHGIGLARIASRVYGGQATQKVYCVVAPSFGATAHRLVCGATEEAVLALYPYMTRGMPTERLSDSDISLRLQMSELRTRYGRKLRAAKSYAIPVALSELRRNDPELDGATTDVVHALADELLALAEDLDEISFELAMDAAHTKCFGHAEIRFRSRLSFLAQGTAAAATRMTVAPDIFWRLPADAQSASYAGPGQPARIEGAAKLLSRLVEGLLGQVSVSKPTRRAVGASLREVLASPGPMAFASGTLSDGPSVPKSEGAAALDSAQGYQVWVLVADDGRFSRGLGALHGLLGDRHLIKFLADQWGDSHDAMPSISEHRLRGVNGLPRDVRAYDVQWTPGARGSGSSGVGIHTTVIVVPGGDVTWVGISADEKRMGLLLRDLLGKKPRALAELPELAHFRTTKLNSGGFFSVSSMVPSIVRSLFESPGRSSAEIQTWTQAMMQSLPNRGRDKIFMAVAASEAGPSVRATITIPKGAVQDLAAALRAAKERHHEVRRVRH
ncbi:MAG: hypothetical protein HRU17_03605 [Polyangiaceae bacterium]|nr:hypothetical protein [Polyangiaceae bacterium]